LTLRAIFVFFQLRLYLLHGFTKQLHFWYLDTSSEYLGHSSVSRSWVQGQGHGSAKAVGATQKLLAKNCWGLIEISVTITLKSSTELLTFTFDIETFSYFFKFKLLSFECLMP